MSPASQEIVTAALKLSESERAVIVECLLATLSPDVDDMDEEEFAAELERRRAEYDRDPSTALPWNIVKDME